MRKFCTEYALIVIKFDLPPKTVYNIIEKANYNDVPPRAMQKEKFSKKISFYCAVPLYKRHNIWYHTSCVSKRNLPQTQTAGLALVRKIPAAVYADGNIFERGI